MVRGEKKQWAFPCALETAALLGRSILLEFGVHPAGRPCSLALQDILGGNDQKKKVKALVRLS